jgi:hypothetical protein
MSKKSKKKVIQANVTQSIHQILRTACRCTENEIEIIDAVLQNMAPHDDVQHMIAVSEGKVTPKPKPTFHIDMENGEFMDLKLTNHPLILMYDYLTEKYGFRFGTLYWHALQTNPQQFYSHIRSLVKTPMFAEIMEEDAQRGSEAGQ